MGWLLEKSQSLHQLEVAINLKIVRLQAENTEEKESKGSV